MEYIMFSSLSVLSVILRHKYCKESAEDTTMLLFFSFFPLANAFITTTYICMGIVALLYKLVKKYDKSKGK